MASPLMDKQEEPDPLQMETVPRPHPHFHLLHADSINSLPIELQKKIYDILPMRQIFYYEAVCRYWKVIQQTLLNDVHCFSLYHSNFALNQRDIYALHFFKPDSYKAEPDHYSLDEYTLTDAKAQYLVDRMLNITSLFIYDSVQQATVFTRLADSWAHQLTTLVFTAPNQDFDWNEFWYNVDRMSALENLSAIGVRGLINSPVLFQLHSVHLEYDETDRDTTLGEMFFSFGENIRAINCSNFADYDQNKDSALVEGILKAQLSEAMLNVYKTQVTNLTLQTHTQLNIETTGHLLDLFGALTHLDLGLDEDACFEVVIGKISHCTQLTNLRLSCNSKRTEFYPVPATPTYYRRLLNRKNPLASVRVLHLSVAAEPEIKSTSPNEHFYKAMLSELLPNLEELHFENFGKLFKCFCTGEEPDFMCTACPTSLYNCFLREFLYLSKVTRNTNVIFNRELDKEDQIAFLERLEEFGQNHEPYRYGDLLDQRPRGNNNDDDEDDGDDMLNRLDFIFHGVNEMQWPRWPRFVGIRPQWRERENLERGHFVRFVDVDEEDDGDDDDDDLESESSSDFETDPDASEESSGSGSELYDEDDEPIIEEVMNELQQMFDRNRARPAQMFVEAHDIDIDNPLRERAFHNLDQDNQSIELQEVEEQIEYDGFYVFNSDEVDAGPCLPEEEEEEEEYFGESENEIESSTGHHDLGLDDDSYWI